MPRVPRSSLVRLAAPPDAVARRRGRAARRDARLDDGHARDRRSPSDTPTRDRARRSRSRRTPTARPTSRSRRPATIDIPFFGWVFRPLVAVAHRRARALRDRDARAPRSTVGPDRRRPKPVVGLPPVAFTPEQSTFIATASAATAIVSFAAALFGQLSEPDQRHASAPPTRRIGVALAVTRLGALFALFAIALADRRGPPAVDPHRRRRLGGRVRRSRRSRRTSSSFTAAQVLQRGLVGTTATVAFLAVVEEAPEGARAYAASMLALAGGFGFSFSVVTLPLADIGVVGLAHPVRARRARRSSSRPRSRASSARRRATPRSRRAPTSCAGRVARRASTRPPAPVRAPRRRGVPAQRVQRAVVAVHEQVPHRRPRLLEHRHRALPHGHDRASPGSSASSSAAGSPKRAGGDRSPRSRSRSPPARR